VANSNELDQLKRGIDNFIAFPKAKTMGYHVLILRKGFHWWKSGLYSSIKVNNSY